MSIQTHVTSAVVLSAFAVFGVGAPASAAPTRVPLVTRQPAIGISARINRPLVVRRFGAAGLYVERAALAPVKALPLVVPRSPAVFVPLVLPRLALATILPVASASDSCAADAPPAKLTSLPVTAYSPVVCTGNRSRADERPGWPTSLAPGHDKNALYGPDFAPHVDIP